jgi:hypothetical protein
MPSDRNISPPYSSVPKTFSKTVSAYFPDRQKAREAIDALLDQGFKGEQLAMVPADASVRSPANDPAIYRATGKEDSHSESHQDDSLPDDHADPSSPTIEETHPHTVLVIVQAEDSRCDQARSLLEKSGGQIVDLLGECDTWAA